MKNTTKRFIECFIDFLSDPEGLTQDEILTELKYNEIDVSQLQKRVTELCNKYKKPISSSEILVILKKEFLSIPIGNFYHADRYDTDDYHVLHLWDDNENSFDIKLLK